MATRIYLSSSKPAPLTPVSWESGWQSGASTTYTQGGSLAPSGSVMATITGVTGTTSPQLRRLYRCVIGRLRGGQISGTLKAQIRCAESNAGANATPAISVAIKQPNGSHRATLLAVAASDLTTTTPPEMVVTNITNRKILTTAESATHTLSTQTATEGDYLVIEIGWRSATTTSRTIFMVVGDNAVADLAEDDSTTAANNPWVEFSQDIQFYHEASVVENVTVGETLNAAPTIRPLVVDDVAVGEEVSRTVSEEPTNIDRSVESAPLTEESLTGLISALSASVEDTPDIDETPLGIISALLPAVEDEPTREEYALGPPTIKPSVESAPACSEELTRTVVTTSGNRIQVSWARVELPVPGNVTERNVSVVDQPLVQESLTGHIPILYVSVKDDQSAEETLTLLASAPLPSVESTVARSEELTVLISALKMSCEDTSTREEQVTALISALKTPTIVDAQSTTEVLTVLISALKVDLTDESGRVDTAEANPHRLFIQVEDATTREEEVTGWIPGAGALVIDTCERQEQVTVLLPILTVSVEDTTGREESLTVWTTAHLASVEDTTQRVEEVTPLISALKRSVEDVQTSEEFAQAVISALKASVEDESTRTETVTPLLPQLKPSVESTSSRTEVITPIISALKSSVEDTPGRTETVSAFPNPLVPQVQDEPKSEDVIIVPVWEPILYTSLFDSIQVQDNVNPLLPYLAINMMEDLEVGELARVRPHQATVRSLVYDTVLSKWVWRQVQLTEVVEV